MVFFYQYKNMFSYYKLIFPLLALGLLCSFSYKYTNLRVQPTAVAHYQFYHIKDTTQLGRVYTEDFILAFNSEKSVYKSQTKINQDAAMQAILASAENQGSNGINMGVILPTTNDDIYTDNGKLAIVKKTGNQNYLINESSAQTNWTITQETKTLLGYTCQKATGICRGRNYTAWFATDIPASYGPWKLYGLPGLILEAYDDRHYIKFTCTKVIVDGNSTPIQKLDVPEDAVATTTKIYERMKIAQAEGIGLPGLDNGVTIDQVVANKGDGKTQIRKKATLNYPLELTN